MNFTVVPQGKALKRFTLSIWLIPLVLLACVVGVLQLAIAIHADLTGNRLSGQQPSGVGLAGLAGAFGIYAWRLRRRQRKLQTALQSLDFDRLTNTGSTGLFLYLRSFRMGRSTLLRRFIPFAYGDQSLVDASLGIDAFHFEEDMSNAIAPHGLLIAIGDRNDSYGAGKVITSDEHWKQRFEQLAARSWAIFIQPDVTESVKWEIGQLLGNPVWLAKTIWLMPRGNALRWNAIREELRIGMGIELPEHQTEGGMFLIPHDLHAAIVMPKVFASILKQKLDAAKPAGNGVSMPDLWHVAREAQAQSLANDRALQQLRQRGR